LLRAGAAGQQVRRPAGRAATGHKLATTSSSNTKVAHRLTGFGALSFCPHFDAGPPFRLTPKKKKFVFHFKISNRKK
jgi:hypothetical protein